MAENSDIQTLFLEDGDTGLTDSKLQTTTTTTQNREQSLGGYNSTLDPGFSPRLVTSSSVGSSDGPVLHRIWLKPSLSLSDMSSALDVQALVDSRKNTPLDIDSKVEDGTDFSTAAHHASVNQESVTFQMGLAQGKDEEDDDNQFQDTGKDDMFVDAPDQLSIMSDGRRSVDIGESTTYTEIHEGREENHDSQGVEDGKQIRQLTYELALLQASLEKTTGEKDAMAHQYMEEREMLGRELANLRWQLDAMANQQLSVTDDGNGLVDRLRQEEKEYREHETHTPRTSLEVMMTDCSKSVAVLKRALEEKLQSEGTIRELNAVLFTKDQEIEGLSGQISELSISHDVIVSYMGSLQQTFFKSLQESSDARAERDLHHEVVMNKLLNSITSIVHQEELSDDCSDDKISLLEKSTFLMIDNYNRFLSEIDLLKQCLTEVVPEGTEFGIVFDRVRRELLDHKRMENDFMEKLSQVEDENKKLLEELDGAKERIDVTDGEMQKIKMEMEQEKSKSVTTKEKLGMAVTKGKALVQQRDSLKQSLAEKANELEKCLLELQEKSNALDSAEMRNQELVKCESLAASLQESLSKREMALEEIEEILSRTGMPHGQHWMDVIERVRWLADQKNELLRVSLEYDKLKSSLGSLNLPEVVASGKLESQISWLGKSISVAEDNIVKLQGELISSKVAVTSLESELVEAFDEIDHLKASLSTEKREKDSLHTGLEDLSSKYKAELVEAFDEIDHLKTSLSTEKREKDSLQIGLEDLSGKYEAVIEREFQATSAKDRMTRMFLEACGMKDLGEFHDPHSDMATFVETCVGKIKEQITTGYSESSQMEIDQFERIQSLLYVRNQEVVLCRDLLEEEMFQRSEMTSIANELKRTSEEIVSLKDEKDSLQKDLERSDEKSALLREKLSMAVKKGKGLFQEREGLRKSVDEKNTEIEKLKLELQQQESVVSECRDQIKGLTSDLERVSKLESDLLAMKNQNDQLEKFLLESNSMLGRVVESIESVVLPVETVFEEPVDKVKWLVDCINEFQAGKTIADQELKEIKEEADSLSRRLTEAHTTIKSLEDVLSEAEKSNFLFAEEKKEMQQSKTYLEQELEKTKEEANAQGNKFLEACANVNSLEEALSQAEEKTSLLEEEKAAVYLNKSIVEKELEKAKEEADYQVSKLTEANDTIKSLEERFFQLEKNVHVLTEERNAAQAGMDSLGRELEQIKDEAGSQSSKLAEASQTIKSLEEGLLQLEKSVSVLTEEKHVAEAGMASLGRELEKTKDEAGSQASKLADVYATVKSLQDALSVSEDNIRALTLGKENAEMEVQALNAKLCASMAELAGTHGSLTNQSAELFGYLSRLQVILNDNSLLSSLTQDFKRKFEGLADMNSHLEDLQVQFVERCSELLQNTAGTEGFNFQKDPCVANTFSAYSDRFANGKIDIEIDAADLDDALSYLDNIIEGFKKKNKLVGDKFKGFSSSMDELIEVLLRTLQSTKANFICMLEPMESLKLDARNLGAYKQALESTMVTLKKDISMLASAWSEAAEHLEFRIYSNLVDAPSKSELEKLSTCSKLGTIEATDDAMDQQLEKLGGNEYVGEADNLANEVHNQIKILANVKNLSLTAIHELQNKQKEAQLASENAMEERDLYRNRLSSLEIDLEALQNLCDELKMKLKDYEANETLLKEKDVEIQLLKHSLVSKEQESEGYVLSEDQIKTLFEKVHHIEILPEKSDLDKSQFHYSDPVGKLFDVIDSFPQLQHQMKLLSHDKANLQSSLAVQVDEIEHLKQEIGGLFSSKQGLEKTESELMELTMNLERLIQKFGGKDLIEGRKFGFKGLVSVLENLVNTSISECETSKSKAQESDAKLHENQKVVDELSEKIKVLEDSIHSGPPLPDSVQERSIFKEPSLPTGSEISEIEDAAPIGRSSVSPAPPAAHVRTLRKGSSDHLAIAIDSESDRLINHQEIDDDKGHAFKSLNTSGLIPKQGKLTADRIDGIWVSGGRVLMSQPRARLGVLAYCILLHLWLLGTIL